MLTQAQLEELKTEINTDPTGIGYDPSATELGVLGPINLVRASISVEKAHISAADVRAATTFDAYDGLLADRQEWLRWVTGSNGVNEESLVVTSDLKVQLTGDGTPIDSMWAVGDRDAMVVAMEALIIVDGSRAEELYGHGTQISRGDWLAARDS